MIHLTVLSIDELLTYIYNMQEIFKDVIGYKGRYKVSNFGNVKSIIGKGRALKGCVASNGYLMLNLHKNGQATRTIHSLVAEAFLRHTPNRFDGFIVDHTDGNKLNNKADNLGLVTNRENTSKKRKGKSKYLGVTCDRGYIHARAQIGGKNIHIGSFKTEYAAHLAYKNYLINHG